jgi:hypothetical protein
MNSAASYRWGVLIAVLTAFGTAWGTIVHDDGNGIGFFMVILAAGVGAFAAWFRADGLARTMAGVAVMHMSAAGLVATAPITAAVPDGPLKYWGFGVVLAALWLVSAACFRRAASLGTLTS